MLLEAVIRESALVFYSNEVGPSHVDCIIMHMRTDKFVRSLMNQLVVWNLRALLFLIILTDGSV